MTRRTSRTRRPVTGRGMSRRDFLRVTGAGVGSAYLLSACGGFGGDEAGGGGDSNTLTFTHGPDDSGSIQALLDEFNRTNSGGLKVNWLEQPADTGAYFDKLRTQFQAGSSSIDVISGDVIWPAQFAANGWIEPLDELISEDLKSALLPAIIESNTYEGTLYGIGWFTDAGMLYYRKDLLDEAGVEVPSSWEDLQAGGDEVVGKTGTKFGFLFQGAQYEGGVCDGCEFIWTHGGNVLDPDDANVVVVDSPEAVEGLSTARGLIEAGVAPDDVVNYQEQQTHETFLAGDAVFARNWPYMYGLAADKSISNIKTSQIGVVALPAAEGGSTAGALGGWNLFINANSEKKEQAVELIEFLASEESQKKKSLKGSFLPTVSSLYDDSEVTDAVPVVALGKEALANARSRPVSPYYSDISLAMQERFNEIFKGEVSAEEGTASLKGEIEDIIAQGG
jgi:multiple sugar transport system substrate-binding protein